MSFGRSKLLSSVFGAGIVTPDINLADHLKKAVEGLPEAPKSLVLRCLLYKILLPGIKYTYPVLIGRFAHRLCILLRLFPREISYAEASGVYDPRYEYAYPEILANTLVFQLDRLPVLLQTIQETVGEYTQHLPHVTRLPTIPLNRFPYLLTKDSDRSHILRHFKKLGIFLGTWYDQPVGPGKVDLGAVRYRLGSCPDAEDITKRIMNLPTNVEEDTAQFVARELNSVVSE
jgi:dTDP-4-amino-4,6-dideoxygalactose transaminase